MSGSGSGGILKAIDPLGGMLGLYGSDKKKSDEPAAPARAATPPREASAALREQTENRMSAGAVSEDENDVNLLGYSGGPKKRSASKALLG